VGNGRKVGALILVENESVPHDRRVMEEARSLLASGFGVSVICPAPPGEPLRESLDGVEVRRYRPRRASGGARSQITEYLVALGKTAWLMVGLARSGGFDVIQACNPPDLFFLIAWPFRLAGKRFIFDQHDLSPELYSTLYGRDRGLIMSLLRWAERMSYRHADAVIACNESYRKLALSRGGVAADRVFIVRNGPREDWPRPVAPDPSLKGGRPQLVVYMGVMGYQDGVDVLLDVIHTLVHVTGFREATFALVGDGNAAEDLKRRARELGIEEFVEFVGWVADEDLLSRYLLTADACVCPEPSSPLNDHSTFIKVMEYMASGTPVVAFDLPETRFSAGDAAVYAAPGDVEGFAARLRGVLTDPDLRAAMRAEASRRTPALRWERQVPNLLAAYGRALCGLEPRAAPDVPHRVPPKTTRDG
jgi:glycosyltransferase involved in cell wall biosynthesis